MSIFKILERSPKVNVDTARINSGLRDTAINIFDDPSQADALLSATLSDFGLQFPVPLSFLDDYGMFALPGRTLVLSGETIQALQKAKSIVVLGYVPGGLTDTLKYAVVQPKVVANTKQQLQPLLVWSLDPNQQYEEKEVTYNGGEEVFSMIDPRLL